MLVAILCYVQSAVNQHPKRQGINFQLNEHFILRIKSIYSRIDFYSDLIEHDETTTGGGSMVSLNEDEFRPNSLFIYLFLEAESKKSNVTVDLYADMGKDGDVFDIDYAIEDNTLLVNESEKEWNYAVSSAAMVY